jgi:antitoxin component YwqK of YwqJK toxin-antitoxin module
MKKLLSILSICLVVVSCSPDRVLYDELTQKGEISYFEGKPFTGVSFNVYDDGQRKEELTYKDGWLDGLAQGWYENGQMEHEYNYRDGKQDGLQKSWYENGQLSYEGTYKLWEKNGVWKSWSENGQLRYKETYKDGKQVEDQSGMQD